MRKSPWVAFGVILLLVFPCATVQAQESPEEYLGVVQTLANDVSLLSENTPVWLAQHLPMMMGQNAQGSGAELGTNFGDFALGLYPIRVGLLNGFNQVGNGTEMISFDDVLPDNLPWMQFGLTAGVGLGWGLQLCADLQFVPDMDLAFGEEINVKVGMISGAVALRWRVNDALGPIPAFVIGIAGSYYHGVMAFGAGYHDEFEYQTTQVQPGPGGINMTVEGAFQGSYAFEGGPSMGWDLWQVAPEVRLAWSLGPVRPYFGFAFGMTFGEVYGGAKITATGEATFKASASVRRVGEQVSETETISYEENEASMVVVEPSLYLMRPFIGLDIVAGIVGIALQVDYAITSMDPIEEDFSTVGSSFSDGLLFSEASKGSVLSEALLASLSVRFIF